MKKSITQLSTSIILILLLVASNLFAQDLIIIVHDTILTDTLSSEMIFDFEIINNSTHQQTVFEVRTINDLPPIWTSSLCFGPSCFSPTTDSVATTPDFGAGPLEEGDTLITSLHVSPVVNQGIAYIQIQLGTFANPGDRDTLNFVAIVEPTAVEDEGEQPNDYFLAQNFPNPFNPSTKISYGIQEAGVVTIKVYNILGSEVVTLVNEHKPAGNYEVSFGEVELASGIYIYRLTANNFIQTRKMILEK
ncbi:MAG: T9SS type A sorting domain-containing protein [Ignavibacteriaceae bacterium]